MKPGGKTAVLSILHRMTDRMLRWLAEAVTQEKIHRLFPKK